MNKRALTYGGALLLVQSLGGCSPESTAPPKPDDRAAAPSHASEQSDGALIVAFGDSLFAGYRLAQNEGLAPALKRALEQRGVPAKVINAGVSGDTSAAGLQRLAFTLDGQPTKPALVIVGLGGNDMLRGIAPSETRANLDAILAELKRRGIPAMLSGMIAAPNLGADYAQEFNAIYPDLAKKYGVPLYPFTLAGVIDGRGTMLGDGIHPSARGVAVMADRIAPMTAEALGEAAR